MKNTIILIIGLFILSGCSGAIFEKGLNYEKTSEYSFEYDEGTQGTTITSAVTGNTISIGFRSHYCGFYGLIGPLIFPIIPIWQNDDCKDIVIGASESYKIHIIYHDEIYKPLKVEYSAFSFPLKIKSIKEKAILVVEKPDGEIFKIPFRYKHTFSFSFFPGR